jgi:hypothetical protein
MSIFTEYCGSLYTNEIAYTSFRCPSSIAIARLVPGFLWLLCSASNARLLSSLYKVDFSRGHHQSKSSVAQLVARSAVNNSSYESCNRKVSGSIPGGGGFLLLSLPGFHLLHIEHSCRQRATFWYFLLGLLYSCAFYLLLPCLSGISWIWFEEGWNKANVEFECEGPSFGALAEQGSGLGNFGALSWTLPSTLTSTCTAISRSLPVQAISGVAILGTQGLWLVSTVRDGLSPPFLLFCYSGV